MKIPQWNKRFLATTRGQIIALLRGSVCTVNQLAEALQVTDNAVRGHLATLERDGLVRQSGLTPGARKPHFTYELTPEAEQLFPKSYGAILSQLLDVLEEELAPELSEQLMREVGHRLAATQSALPNGCDLEARAQAVVDVLRELGGLARLERQDGKLYIRGDGCPLAAASAHHPDVCRMAETLVADITQMPVQEHCVRGDSPQCCFQIGAVDSAT